MMISSKETRFFYISVEVERSYWNTNRTPTTSTHWLMGTTERVALRVTKKKQTRIETMMLVNFLPINELFFFKSFQTRKW
jgi:hypothetical protein